MCAVLNIAPVFLPLPPGEGWGEGITRTVLHSILQNR